MTQHAPALRPSTELGLSGRMPGTGLADLPRVAPPTRINGLVFWLLLLGVGLFGGLGPWAALAPMKSAVVAGGTFRVEGDRQVVQHLEGGIVRDIRVTEGATVAEGDVIAVLDDTRAKASLGILRNQLVAALAKDARLESEMRDRDQMQVSQELAELSTANPDFADLVKAQWEVFQSNKKMTDGQIEILESRVAQLQQRRIGVEERHKALSEQVAMLREERQDMEVLLEQKLTTKPRYLAVRREESDVGGEAQVAASDLEAIDSQIGETRQRILQIRRDRLLQISDERQELKEKIFDIRQRIEANEDVARRLTIRAPRAGRVVGLEINTLGEVIQPGQPLLEIVPADSAYLVHAQVRPDDIDQIREGGEARVRLTAYNFRTTPQVKGTVTYVSPDSLLDEPSGQSYYRVDIRVNEAELEALDGVDIQPGMQAQVMISTGEQTLADYLLSPVIGGLETALIESD
ncbi:MAG: HlyD family type I secretion periplasmic adaptor subunit [Paracoccaceae bacterium]